MMVAALVIYYIGWYLSIAAAALNRPYLAASVGFGAWIIQIIIFYFYDKRIYYSGIYLSVYAFFIGLATESIFLNLSITGFYSEGVLKILPPLWIILLYPLLALTVCNFPNWLKESKWIQAMIGALAPLCYLGGEKAGVCILPRGELVAYLVIGVVWAVIIVGITALSKMISKQINHEKNRI